MDIAKHTLTVKVFSLLLLQYVLTHLEHHLSSKLLIFKKTLEALEQKQKKERGECRELVRSRKMNL